MSIGILIGIIFGSYIGFKVGVIYGAIFMMCAFIFAFIGSYMDSLIFKENGGKVNRVLKFIFKWVLPILVLLLAVSLSNGYIGKIVGIIGLCWLGLSIFFSLFRKKNKR